jgi:hypothetical protein
LTDEEFLDISPRQFSALIKQYKSSLEGPEFMLAQLTAAIYNTGFKSPEKQVNPVDYMPSQWAKKAKVVKAGVAVRMTKKKRQQLSGNLNAILMEMIRKPK